MPVELQRALALAWISRHDREMVRPRSPALAPLTLIIAASCSAGPSILIDTDERPEARDLLRVELLDAGFLTADGRRMAIPEFEYRCRLDNRRWAAKGLKPPKVILTFAPELIPQRVVSDLMDQLQLSGFTRVEVKFLAAPETRSAR